LRNTKPQPWTLRRNVEDGERPWLGLASKTGLSANAARLAWLRGMTDPSDLAWRLDPTWSRTHAPLLLDGMARATERIHKAVANGEKICIFFIPRHKTASFGLNLI
jgi:hypothetical protein